MIQERLETYNGEHCWQYDIRLRNLTDDLNMCGITKDEADSLRVSDFKFSIATCRKEELEVRQFIERHEWLGKACGFSQYYFMAHYKGILSGVIVMGTPNAYNLLLGEDNRDLELLINRGACISWSPKNLASSLMSYSINWIVNHTSHRLFTAYSDPTAKELGTIYQACNFYYLGQTFGADKKYRQPYNNGLVSDRWFRTRCAYKRYALDLGIEWGDWLGKGRKVVWDKVPDDIEHRLREYSKKKQSEAEYIEIPPKHKYAYVLGRNKTETKQLKRLFESRNKVFPYPKERGK
jgi:hypothetical protein